MQLLHVWFSAPQGAPWACSEWTLNTQPGISPEHKWCINPHPQEGGQIEKKQFIGRYLNSYAEKITEIWGLVKPGWRGHSSERSSISFRIKIGIIRKWKRNCSVKLIKIYIIVRCHLDKFLGNQMQCYFWNVMELFLGNSNTCIHMKSVLHCPSQYSGHHPIYWRHR